MPAYPYMPTKGSDGSSVTSVNGEQGDVVLTAQDLQAQPHSTVLTDIAAITMPNNSLLVVGGTGSFSPATCMPAGVAWLGYSTVDQQKQHLALSEVASSGSYQDLEDTPELFSGDYNDLTSKPSPVSVPTKTSDLINDSGFLTSITAQVNTDWNSTGGVSQLLNKPSFASVVLSGSYNDLTNKPTIPSTQVPSDWTSVSGVSQILNKPTLFSGSYTDLTSKPSLFDGTWTSLTGKPTTFTPSAHNQAWSTITSTPTTLAGYGVTDAYPLASNPAGYLTSVSLAGFRKTETFLGTTDASGNLTITFANTYTTPPDVQPQVIGGTFNQMVRVVSVTNTGCVVQAAQRNLVTLLSVEVLLGATVNLVGASVSVQITARS